MLIDTLQSDLTTAMKAREELDVSVLRMAISAVREEAVSGDTARELTDDEVLKVLAREAKRRDEAAAAFDEGGRDDRAARERAEHAVLARYLPQPMSEAELAGIVSAALADGGFHEPSQMGLAMKAAMAAVAGRADGKVVSALVKATLAG